MLVVAKYYSRITLARLAELLDLPVEEARPDLITYNPWFLTLSTTCWWWPSTTRASRLRSWRSCWTCRWRRRALTQKTRPRFAALSMCWWWPSTTRASRCRWRRRAPT